MNISNVIYLNCEKRYADIDDQLYTQLIMSSCEMKAWKNSGLSGIPEQWSTSWATKPMFIEWPAPSWLDSLVEHCTDVCIVHGFESHPFCLLRSVPMTNSWNPLMSIECNILSNLWEWQTMTLKVCPQMSWHHWAPPPALVQTQLLGVGRASTTDFFSTLKKL